MRKYGRGRLAGLLTFVLGLVVVAGCNSAKPAVEGPPIALLDLRTQGLSKDYARFDDDYCTGHVIGYRFLVWLPGDFLAVGFNASPGCRAKEDVPVSGGLLRVLVVDRHGSVKARRDLIYESDGGQEIVAPGEAMAGPGGTLAVRIEEAGSSKSGVLLLNDSLQDVVRIDRFMERGAPINHTLVFQQGFVSSGPRTYDVFTAAAMTPTSHVTWDSFQGTMDSMVGAWGSASMLCGQQLGGKYQQTNVIYSGASRRCALTFEGVDGLTWSAPLGQDQVAGIVDYLSDGTIAAIVRSGVGADQLMVLSKDKSPEALPWFADRYETKVLGGTAVLTRYVGYGELKDGRFCNLLGIGCSHGEGRLMIFDREKRAAIVDRTLAMSGRAAMSADGTLYAVLNEGVLSIYSLPEAR